MKRLFTIIATHTAALLLGFSIAFFTAHFNRPRVVLDKSAVSYSIDVPTIDGAEYHPIDEILALDTAVQGQDGIVFQLDDLTFDENNRFDFVIDFPGHTEIRAELQRLKAENRSLKILKKLQAEVKMLKRENQKLRKETDTQHAPAENPLP